MCRLFALRAAAPVSVLDALASDANSLSAQSRRDSRGQSHVDGWGLAFQIDDGKLEIERSLKPAHEDPKFRQLAEAVRSRAIVAHVRQASVGNISLVNTHPFQHGRWIFAHNGTLQNFAERREPMLRAIPPDLRNCIRGTTDSEHAFYYWLSQLRTMTGTLEQPVEAAVVEESLAATVRSLDRWFPAHDGEESRFNVVLTDGWLLAATRWKHMLSWRESGGETANAAGNSASRAVFIASEPTGGDGWREVADRSQILVDEQLNVRTRSMA